MDEAGDRSRTLEDIEREHLMRSLARHGQGVPPFDRPTIHYSQMREMDARSPLAQEWNSYRRQAGRLLADGHEGKWGMIEGEEIIGIWETWESAEEYRLLHYPHRRVLVKQVLTREVVFRVGYNRLLRPIDL